MIKPRCPICHHIYLGKSCPCKQGKTPRRLSCECGKPAKEIFVDHLGEWPLCEDCLALEQDGFAALPLPDFSTDEQPAPTAPLPKLNQLSALPFDLTEKEYEVARLAHLSNRQIADRLSISPETVHTHMKVILRKLSIRSRYEIPYRLNAAISAAELGEQESPDQVIILLKKEPSGGIFRLALCIRGCFHSLEELLADLRAKLPPHLD